MFTPEEGELWQKAPEYLHDATYYYSLWNGDYPYNQVTAVDGTISAGGGMEYPNVTVIGRSGSDSGLETVIVHEVGHNWFYGILGSNERENAWMDEGINSFNETRYLLTKYGENKDISLLLGGENNLAKRFELDDFQYKWIDELSYLFPARFGADQPIQCHSNSLTQLNYGAIIYKKTAAAFAMLQSHLGTERFDAAMQLYFDTWKFRHPSPKDLQVAMEKSTGEDLSWFFEDWIQTTKRNDLKLVSVNAKSSGPATFRGIKVRNVGELSSSARVSGLVGDSVVAVIDLPLMAPGEVVEAPVPQVDVDRWVLDHDRVTLDYDRSNNVPPHVGRGGALAIAHADPVGKSGEDACILGPSSRLERAQRPDGRGGASQPHVAPARLHLPVDATAFDKFRGRRTLEASSAWTGARETGTWASGALSSVPRRPSNCGLK